VSLNTHGLVAGAEREQRVERGVRVAPAVVPKDELVEMGM
jgi:hypothetical protein